MLRAAENRASFDLDGRYVGCSKIWTKQPPAKAGGLGITD
jgi:hypothetical protein